MPPGAAVPVQGVPPMSDITAGMPGLDFMERGICEKPDQKGSSSSSASAHVTTRLTRTGDGVVATAGVTEGVHGSHGESLTLAPEPASRGAARRVPCRLAHARAQAPQHGGPG